MTQHGVMVALKRVYDEPEPGDGTRVLVERLWPCGLSKERAHDTEHTNAVVLRDLLLHAS